jgi:hypothetical protein
MKKHGRDPIRAQTHDPSVERQTAKEKCKHNIKLNKPRETMSRVKDQVCLRRVLSNHLDFKSRDDLSYMSRVFIRHVSFCHAKIIDSQ